MNCVQLAWSPSSRASKPQTVYLYPAAQGQTLSPVKLLLQPGVRRQGGLCNSFPVVGSSLGPPKHQHLSARKRKRTQPYPGEGRLWLVLPITHHTIQNTSTKTCPTWRLQAETSTMQHPGQSGASNQVPERDGAHREASAGEPHRGPALPDPWSMHS